MYISKENTVRGVWFQSVANGSGLHALSPWARLVILPRPSGMEVAPMSIFNDVKHWRARAREARIQAEQMPDEEMKQAMLKIAEQYEQLATRAEGRIAK
jgi:hypothetical protein